MREKKAINQQVGSHIKTIREKNEYTQERFSELLGITPNHLSAIERGASGATLEMLDKLCKIFGVSADFLFYGDITIEDDTMILAHQLGNISEEYKPQVKKVILALLEVLEKGKDGT